jgi:hypothetical protein
LADEAGAWRAYGGFVDTGATNRQKKVLRLYEIPHIDALSCQEASWEITALWQDSVVRERWDKYVYLTEDFDDSDDQLRPFDRATLDTVVLPPGWDRHDRVKKHREALAALLLKDASPFNDPQPQIIFKDKIFVFTGTLEYAPRSDCELDVRERGGRVAKAIGHTVDYLVIGAKGNSNWKHGAYGRKIEDGLLERRANRRLAIISETHWRSFLTPVADSDALAAEGIAEAKVLE